ncbi:MAG TPA: DUF4292 domain-containing protein [Bacteroidales bacterium]|jgi:hypothetical protein|nr:DUF4292 domain-containing protein [Bacteroidales bacterium]
MQKVIVAILISIVFLGGCSTIKRRSGIVVDRTYTAENVSDIVGRNISGYDFFIQKADITVLENNSTARFLALVKYKRPDSLSLSFRTRLGIEAARILITADTLIISDRINKRTRIGKPEELKEKYGIEPKLIFTVLGDIIVEQRDEKRRIKCSNGIFENEYNVGGRQVNYTIDCRNAKLVRTNFFESRGLGILNLEFAEFIQVGPVVIPGLVKAKSDLNNIEVTVKVEKAEIGYKGVIGFKSPANYRIIGLK